MSRILAAIAADLRTERDTSMTVLAAATVALAFTIAALLYLP